MLRWRMPTLICHCGKSFDRPKAHIRNRTHSCSRECAEKIRHIRPTTWTVHVCAHCKSEFRRRKGYSGTMRFCSNECRIGGIGAPDRSGVVMPSGSNHHNWKGGTSKRTHADKKAVKRRVREIGECERCGSREQLHGHHKKSYANHPQLRVDPSNIEVLCASCHAEEHPELAPMLRRPIERTGSNIACIICDQERYVPPHKIKTAKFCSRACQMSHLNATNGDKLKNGAMVKCEICDKPYYVPKHKLATTRFCSNECRSKSTSARMKGNTYASRRPSSSPS